MFRLKNFNTNQRGHKALYKPNEQQRMSIPARAGISAPSLPLHVEKALDAVIAARKDFEAGNSAITEETIQEMLSKIEFDASASKLNRIFLEDNDGAFDAFPLTGRIATRTSIPLPLGVLSFGVYGPQELVVHVIGADELTTTDYNVTGVYKGAYGDLDTAYIVSTAFRIPNSSAVGVSRTIGTYSYASDCRLDIKFTTMRLEPLAVDGDAMHSWKELLLPHNPGMDPETGVLEVELPNVYPGWQDYLLMGEKHQLLKGNHGSVILLKRNK